MKEKGNTLRHIGYETVLILSFTLLAWTFGGWGWSQENQPAETETTDSRMVESTDTGAAETPSDSEQVDLNQSLPAEESGPETSEPETSAAAADAVPAEEPAEDPAEKAPDTVAVEVSKGNVRLEPSLDAAILTQLVKGDTVKVLETKEDWYHVQLPDGDAGWAHKSLFSAAETSKTVTVDVGNVRAEPSTRADIKTRLRKGNTVKILDSREDWYRVRTPDGETGWMHDSLFATSPAKKRKPAASEKYQLEAIRIESGNGLEEKAYFVFNGPKPPKTFFTKTGPTRVVCNFPNTRLHRGISPDNPVNGALIKKVRIGLHGENKSDAWVVFDLAPGQKYELEHIFMEGRIYMLIFKKV